MAIGYRAKLALGLALLAGCSGGDDGPHGAGATRQALQIPGLTPVPCDAQGRSLWGGTVTELLVADAWAQCATIANTAINIQSNSDDYLQEVFSRMTNTVNTVTGVETWFYYRSGLPRFTGDTTFVGNNNCEASGLRVKVPLTLDHAVREMPTAFFNGQAHYDLRSAGINLCIAQRLRSLSPGATGGEALLMSDADQREFAEVIRERAQMAMLQYAWLASAFAGNRGFGGRVGLLRDWITAPFGRLASGAIGNFTSADVRSMGQDFAAAVQLHTIMTEEISRLMARSRSARLPYRAPAAATRAQDEWGPMSWHQRLLSVGFGGDPLTPGKDGAWVHPFGLITRTSSLPTLIEAGARDVDWPSPLQLPFGSADARQPQVNELYGLARRFDQLRLWISRPNATSGCRDVLVPESGDLLFQNVETALRRYTCELSDEPPQDCSTSVPADDLQTYLWKLFRIERTHAHKLAELLRDVVGARHDDNPPPSGCRDTRLGVVRIDSDLPVSMLAVEPRGSFCLPGSPCPDFLKIHKDVDFAPRGLMDAAPNFTRFAKQRLPTATELIGGFAETEQGMSNFLAGTQLAGIAHSKQRRMGALAALSATRSLIISALEAAPSLADGPRKTNLLAYLEHGPRMSAVIDAAVGGQGIRFLGRALNLNSVFQVLPPLFGAGGRDWALSIEAPPNDPFWQPSGGENIYAIAIGDDVLAGDLLQSPKTRIHGRTALDVLRAAVRRPLAVLPSVANVNTTRLATPENCSAVQDVAFGCGLLLDPNRRSWTLAAWRATPAQESTLAAGGNVELDEKKLRVLAANVWQDPGRVADGQYLAYDGATGDYIKKQTEPDPFNPTRHRYDAFGLPESWVPAFSAELLGGSSQEGAPQYYLDAARSAADNATQAVQRALDGLLERTKAEADVSAQTARSQQLIEEAVETMCGTDRTSCDVQTRLTALDGIRTVAYPSLGRNGVDLSTNPATGQPTICTNLPIVFPVATGNVESPNITFDSPVPLVPDITIDLPDFAEIDANDSQLAKDMLDCFIKIRLVDFLKTETELAQPVEALLGRPAVPAFEEFSGGTLQNAFIEQWRAIKAPDERFEALVKSQDASNARVDAAAAVVARAEKRIRLHCGVAAFARAVAAGFNFGFPSGISWSPGPLNAQYERCQEAMFDADVVVKEETATIKDTFSSLANAVVGLTDAQAAIAQSGATISRIKNETKLAMERAALESQLTAQTQITSFGLYRRYRDYDLWRARALLENARRYGLAARRSIEARYVVDLSELTQPEAFVASPATWADEVYEYDLSLPASVGLAVGVQTPDGIYANKVSDYVTNLEGFITGFAAQRPSAVANEDIEVVTLPGLSRELGDASLPTIDGGSLQLSTSKSSWFVLCPGPRPTDPGTWVGVPTPEVGGVALACMRPACSCSSIEQCAEICADRPLRARLVFGLDPWGRRNDSILNEPFDRRYNGRWQRLAVNFVGTGVKDCTKAPDPLGCYGEGFLRYDLRHAGRPWVTDFGGAWRALGMPSGEIEGAKGLAAELWLDPLKDGWDTSYISAVARTEFFLRPLGGAYEIEFTAGPEVVLERIERVQLLVGSTYWVQQD